MVIGENDGIPTATVDDPNNATIGNEVFKMGALDGHMFCSACGESTEPTEEFVSACCWEPIVNENGATLTVEAIMAYIDESDEYYEEEGLKKR